MSDNVWLKTSLLLSEIEDCIKEDLSETDAAGLPVMAIYALCELYERDGQRTFDLSMAVGNLTTSFSWIVNKLEKQGFIKRIINENDRRSSRLWLTPKAIETRKMIEQAIGNAEVRYGGG